HRLREHQRITLDEACIEPTLQLGVAVAYHDEALLVLHKPPGLAVHTGPLVDRSVADLLRPLPGSGLAHRLDREASGLLLAGRNATALRHLGAAMARGEVTRTYEAIVTGAPAFDERTIDLPLLVTDEPRGDRPKTIVDDAGKPSTTHVTVLARRGDLALVRARIATGRTHQIRAHLQAVGHPILGDARYGDPRTNAHARATHGVHRTLLHSAELRFPRSHRGENVVVHAVWEPDFARLFDPDRRPPRSRSAADMNPM
ncbi:MAG TPA: RluA family pseudouridine synthase, partial [bacterium]|nr:RluA family pseudouridine synthase [bacterium]